MKLLMDRTTQFEMSDERASWLLEHHIIEPVPGEDDEYQLVDGPQREVALNLLYLNSEDPL